MPMRELAVKSVEPRCFAVKEDTLHTDGSPRKSGHSAGWMKMSV